MIVTLKKNNEPTIENLSKEEQLHLNSVELSYEELSNNYIMAMIFGHGVDVLNIELCDTKEVNAIIALMMSAKKINVISVENCNGSFEVFSRIYPEKIAELRRAKMLGKSMLEVITNG